jgi:hypothetical protein
VDDEIEVEMEVKDLLLQREKEILEEIGIKGYKKVRN